MGGAAAPQLSAALVNSLSNLANESKRHQSSPSSESSRSRTSGMEYTPPTKQHTSASYRPPATPPNRALTVSPNMSPLTPPLMMPSMPKAVSRSLSSSYK